MREITVRSYSEQDIPAMIEIWNEIVTAGDAFPQTELLDVQSGTEFFEGQSYCGVAVDLTEDLKYGQILGLYILHPNNIGRCGHISNASYAVTASARGHHVGEALVRDCIVQGKRLGFRILQFNAVVRSNIPAHRLYEKLGFTQLGVIPGGFLMKSGEYVDICPYFKELSDKHESV